MRIRFKPWARPELEASKFYIDNPEEYKGKWLTLFKNMEYHLMTRMKHTHFSVCINHTAFHLQLLQLHYIPAPFVRKVRTILYRSYKKVTVML